MAPIIQGKSLVKSVGDKIILRGISIEIAEGETVAILGPNGAGKSTLLKIFSTLLKPSSGELTVDGQTLKEDIVSIRRKIGFLPHNSLLYDNMTAAQNLAFYGKMYRIPDLNKRIEVLLRQVGLYHFRDEQVRSFSRGMIQRLSIARAILHQPRILLLDEPHTGLDVEAIQLLNSLILDLKQQGCSVVMVTHDFEQALAVSDRILILRRGKIITDFSPVGMAADRLHRIYEEQVVG